LPIAAFIIIGYASYVNISNMLYDEAWVTHTQTVMDKTDSLLVTLLNAETGARGYVITEQDKYLVPYNLAISNWDNQLNELKQLTADNPVQQANIVKLSQLANSKLAFLQQYVDLRKNSTLDTTITFVDNGNGKELMDSVRQVIGDMKSQEQTLLDQRSHTSESAASYTEYVILFGTIIAVIVTIVTTLAINKKLTERQKLERSNIELQLQSQQLRDADVAKEEFTTMVSHELKTPLVTISGYAEMLKETDSILGPLNEEQIKAVEKISVETAKLERLIGDIMDAQKIDLERMKFNKNEFEIKEFLDEQIQIHSKLMNDKKIHFANTTNETVIVSSDSYRLSQVFANLIKNAVDFVPQTDGSIEINAHRKNGHVVFYVKDNGSGIPKEKQDNLFKKFYQVDTSLKRSHGGTGLGLVICKGIVEALGGKIWLESEIGKGTTIFFTIPRNGSNGKHVEQ